MRTAPCASNPHVIIKYWPVDKIEVTTVYNMTKTNSFNMLKRNKKENIEIVRMMRRV